jgi:hypothetical protein
MDLLARLQQHLQILQAERSKYRVVQVQDHNHLGSRHVAHCPAGRLCWQLIAPEAWLLRPVV